MQSNTSVYRKIFTKAFKTAWRHRELWFLAALAGLLGTGTVLNDVLAQARNTLFSPGNSFSTSSDLVAFLNIYFNSLGRTDVQSAISSFCLFLGLAVAFIATAITAQHIILRTAHRASSKKSPLPRRALISEARHPRFHRLLILNIFFKVLLLNLLIATGFLLSTLSPNAILSDLFFGLLFAFSMLVLVFTLNVIYILSLIAVTRDNATLLEALEEALETFAQHPVVCFEISILLFGLNFLFTTGYLGALLVAAGPIMRLFTLTLESGNLFAFSAVSVLSIMLFLSFTIAFGGFMTLFTYSAWTELAYGIMQGKKITPRFHAHSKRLLTSSAR